MRLLLDTRVFLWWVADDAKLSATARTLIGDETNDIFVSAVVGWEIDIKRSLAKLRFVGDVEDVVMEAGFKTLPIDFRHTAETAKLPPIHHDPFDRLLVAQARVESLELLTADSRILTYPVRAIDVREEGIPVAIDSKRPALTPYEIREMIDAREKAERDWISRLRYAEREGLELGRELGRQQSLEQGASRTRKAMLAQLLQSGMSKVELKEKAGATDAELSEL